MKMVEEMAADKVSTHKLIFWFLSFSDFYKLLRNQKSVVIVLKGQDEK